MEKKNNRGIIILMGVIIGVLLVLCVLFATDTIKFNSKVTNNSTQNTSTNKGSEQNKNGENSIDNNQKNKNENSVTKESLLKIIEDELFIFFMWSEPNRKISDLDNQSKLYMALNKLENAYAGNNSSEIYVEIENFSKKELEKYFNSSCLSNLTINHEDIAEFKYDSENETYSNSHLMPKIEYRYRRPHAKKIVSYKSENDIYKISLKYLFPDDQEGYQYYYGDLEYKNKIIKAIDENNNYIDVQKYLDENFDSIKDKLATYDYTFKYENNKLILSDFSID